MVEYFSFLDKGKHRMSQAQFPEKIALTGGTSTLGNLLISKLVDSTAVNEIHIFDIRAPLITSNKIIFHRMNLVRDDSDSELAKILIEQNIDTFVHGALFSGPNRNQALSREVESIGTFHVLNAVAEAKIKKLLVHSSTFVYGAHAQNPNFIPETSTLKPIGPTFVRTRVDVEKQIQEFARDYTETAVTVLRFAPILGPNASNVRARYFLAQMIPKVLGYDPLLQFIHEEDALQASLLALSHKKAGVFNIVGSGVLPLSTGIHLSGKIPVPVATPICRTIFGIGYALRLWELPSVMMSFFQYLCVADGKKAQKVLGFTPRFSSRQALKSMIESARLRSRGFAVPSYSLGEDNPNSTTELGFERI